ncbi:hypothetical protein U9M48_030849, partial [Paspalum notatum var. saurae]
CRARSELSAAAASSRKLSTPHQRIGHAPCRLAPFGTAAPSPHLRTVGAVRFPLLLRRRSRASKAPPTAALPPPAPPRLDLRIGLDSSRQFQLCATAQSIGGQQSVISFHEGQCWASLALGGQICNARMGHTHIRILYASFCFSVDEQKFVLGVILMVPCYEIESYVSLINPDTSVCCGILRDGYEAFAMYCFGRYITACLGGEDRTLAFLKREGGEDSGEPLLHDASENGVIHHHFPINYILKPWRLGVRFYQIIKFGIFQYVIIKMLTASLSLILQPFGVYCDGEFNWGVLNFSQYWALYCLVEWYTATKDELAHIQPLAKFLSFKSIVFLTWWQGVIIAIMYSLGLVRSPLAQSLELKTSIQDFIICIEMGIASVVHLYVFPAKPYELLGKQYSPTNISGLGDYAASDPVDPDEIKDIS